MFPLLKEPWTVLFASAASAVLHQLPYYTFAYLKQNDYLADIAASSGFILIIWFAALSAQFASARLLLISIGISLWAMRLGVFSYRRMCFRGREPRFDEFRARPLALLGFWLVQAAWTWTGTLPVVLAWSVRNVSHHDRWVGAFDVPAILLWSGGLLIETIADEQRLCYLRTRKSPETVLRDGLWRWSRHPNYFGEIMHWFGISLACMPALKPLAAQWPIWTRAAALAPTLMTIFLILAVSGLPMNESYHTQRMHRFGDWPAYVAYLNTTSPLVPLSPDIWRRLPHFVKCLLCERSSWSQPPSDASLDARRRESADTATS